MAHRDLVFKSLLPSKMLAFRTLSETQRRFMSQSSFIIKILIDYHIISVFIRSFFENINQLKIVQTRE